jgi:hypothetical protein
MARLIQSIDSCGWFACSGLSVLIQRRALQRHLMGLRGVVSL